MLSPRQVDALRRDRNRFSSTAGVYRLYIDGSPVAVSEAYIQAAGAEAKMLRGLEIDRPLYRVQVNGLAAGLNSRIQGDSSDRPVTWAISLDRGVTQIPCKVNGTIEHQKGTYWLIFLEAV